MVQVYANTRETSEMRVLTNGPEHTKDYTDRRGKDTTNTINKETKNEVWSLQ